MEELKIIKKYLEERIRIDSLPDGFAKAYNEATIKHQNIKILGLLSNLERAYGNQDNSKPANCAIFDVSGSLPDKFADIIRFIESDLMEVKLYGNDGFDNQEELDGKEYLVRLIKEAVGNER